MLLCLPASGCTFFIGRSVATSPAGRSEAPATPAAKASHDQLCSELRADIASSQHNQRSAAPASNTAIIAAASEGKEDQKIEALRKRYAQMGCVGNPQPAGDAATP